MVEHPLQINLGSITVAYVESEVGEPLCWQRRSPAQSLEIITGGRHGLTLEQREVTAGLVRDFVLAHALAPEERLAP